MSHILHINDNNLLVQSATSVERSQGYAWMKGDRVIFDSDGDISPVRHCRLAPQEINNHYWQRCEQSAITSNAAGMRHAADLIWKHLSSLKSHHGIQSTVLVLPSHYQPANLQLLLGVARSCGIEIPGLVNKAVVALHKLESEPGDYRHLDVQLHQTVSSVVSIGGGRARLGSVEVLQGVGIHAMQDALLKALQDSFIQNDRFDPLHDADTEQQLFDQLAEIATQIEASGKANISVQHQSQLHTTSIDRSVWDAALAPFVKQLLTAGLDAKHVYIDTNSAFEDSPMSNLEGAGVTLIKHIPTFEPGKYTGEQEPGDALVYQTALACSSINPARPQTDSPDSTSEHVTQLAEPTGATHLLQAGIAVAIEHAELRTDDNQLSLHTTSSGNAEAMLKAGKLFVMNDEGRQTFQPNDRIGTHLADGVVTVIQVV